MFQISRKADYAIRGMLHLALDVRQELRALPGCVTLERLAGAMPETPGPSGRHNRSQL
ncbi:MAG: hypothetical protein PHT96_09910 [Syntrophorhabdaceae bacterium]|nr:hypothetical protein [Syntrophorhabdaceae bacterium]